MSSELKPCPFCDVKKTWLRRKMGMYYVICESCGSRTGYWFSEKQAIAAWNTRAERTCNRVIKTNERTGKTVLNQWYACSECGNPMGSGENFCASCGAKVVGD